MKRAVKAAIAQAYYFEGYTRHHSPGVRDHRKAVWPDQPKPVEFDFTDITPAGWIIGAYLSSLATRLVRKSRSNVKPRRLI